MRTQPVLRSVLVLVVLAVGACRNADRPHPPGALSTSYREERSPPDDLDDTSTDGSAATDGATPTEPSAASSVPGPGGLPLPSDAAEQSGLAPAGGKLVVFKVPRDRNTVIEELRASLASDGWTIDAEELSPSHRALRWKVSKDGSTLDVRVTGDGNDAGIIITLP